MTMLQSYDTNQFEAFLFNVETEATKIAADKAAIEEADKEAQRIVEKEQRAAEELRIENEEKQKVLDDEKEKLAADKAAFEKEKTDAATKKANEEKLQLEIAKAKEDARIAAEKKVADEKAAAEKKVADDKKKADAIEARRILAAERKERLKSDKAKLDDLAFKFEELQYPTVKQKEAIDIIAAFQKDIATLVANLILDAAGLE